MDIQLIGFISVVETVVMTGLKESWNLATTPRSVLIQIFLELFLVQYLVVKLYRIFIYPFYVSPLRHLPTPKVSVVSYISPTLFVSLFYQYGDLGD